MGTWGTGIHQNDVGEDVKEEYISKLKAGKTDEEALNEILKEYEKQIDDDDDVYDVYFSLADEMWKKGRLTEEIKNKALELISQEEQSGRWESEGLQKQRHKVLMKLQERLLSEMPEKKKIPIHKPYVMEWKAGEVYTYQIKNPPEEFKEYKGWYVLYYVNKIRLEEWNVRGMYDEAAEIFAFICKEEPQDMSVMKIATPVCFRADGDGWNMYRVMLLERSKRQRPKDIKLIGKCNDFKYPDKEHYQIDPIFWLSYEKDILWGYRNQLRLEKEQKDSL